ncbi:MAG: response regulator [Candidatus Parvarchaeota archaeon]|nr:response regulator [Candidatus Rehaiarchaeum fermentans]
MLRVFIVEDENFDRDRIRELLFSFKDEFVYCGEASDGEIAYPMICEIKPDIVLTDIKMPLLDGLELSALIKKSMPWIKIIIISAYDYFDYAKQALSVGVEEYLIKPFSSEDLLNSLRKVKKIIEEERILLSKLNYLENQITNNKSLLEKRFYNRLFQGTLDVKELYDEAVNLNIDLAAKYYAIMSIECFLECKEKDTFEDFLVLQDIIYRLVNRNKENMLLYVKSDSEIIVILKSNNKEELEENLFLKAQAIQYEIESNTNYITHIGISSICDRLSEIPRIYKEAQKAKSLSFLLSQRKVIYFSDLNLCNNLENSIEPEINDFQDILDEIDEILRCRDISKIDSLVSRIEEEFRKLGDKSFKLFPRLYLEIAFRCYELLKNYNMESNIWSLIVNHIFQISADMSQKSFGEIIKELLLTTLNTKMQVFNKKYNSIIKKVLEIIESEYQNSSLSLSLVADMIGINMSYLSLIFKQEMGQTFIEHLTNVRINKAKELLMNSDLKVADISSKVGYNEPHYFSFLFKKKTGLSPQEFRSKNNS